MNFVKAQANGFEAIYAHYLYLIEHTPNMERYARWKKGLHPTAAAIKEYIDGEAMYTLMDGHEIAGAMAVTMQQGVDYHEICWGVAAKDDEVAVVHLLGVNPAYQGRGVGRQMIDEALRLAKAQHKKAVRLDALASNLPAQRLYLAKGFLCKGKLRLYADNTGWTDFFFYEYAL